MKRVFINLMICVGFIIIYFIQINFFSWFKIAGVMPNLFVIYILFIGLFYSRTAGLTYGIAFGLLIDIFISKKVGISAVMLGITGVIGGIFDKNFSKENRFTIIVMVLSSTLIYEIGHYILGYFVYNYNFEILKFVKILIIESIYNILITIIIYPLIQKLGYKIEEEYKGSKILTRYF